MNCNNNKIIACGFGNGKSENLLLLEDYQVKYGTFFDKCGYLCPISDTLILAAKEDEADGSELCIYKLGENGFSQCDSYPVPIGSLCHVSFNHTYSLAMGACYNGGVIFSIPVSIENEDFCGELSADYQTNGSEVSRAHFIETLQDGSVLSVNIELSRLYKYIPSSEGLIADGFIQLPKGAGPRHFCEGRNGDIYIITEYSNEILRVKNCELVERISTLAFDYEGESFGGSIAISQNRRRLYASNRGENSVALFNIGEDGSLSANGRFSVKDWPRHIALVNNDSVLAVAAERDNSLVFHLLDENGLCSGIESEIELHGACFAK